MAQIIDLDELLGADKKVKLGGEVYSLPPDLPVELYLRIVKFGQQEQSEADTVEALYDELLSLFRYKRPGLEGLPVSMTQLVVAIAKIYGDAGEAEAAEPVRPPRRKASGGATKTSPSGTRRTASR